MESWGSGIERINSSAMTIRLLGCLIRLQGLLQIRVLPCLMASLGNTARSDEPILISVVQEQRLKAFSPLVTQAYCPSTMQSYYESLGACKYPQAKELIILYLRSLVII